jgi:hypothetical protein
MNVSFACPLCDSPDKVFLPGPIEWQCPACDHRLHVEAHEPTTCAICGNRELYKKKDFPHWLGMTILVAACLASVFTYGWYEKWLTWAILLGSAVFDCLLYLWVGDALVCYRCNAHYRGFKARAEHRPFELSTGERYRQERIRRELLESKKKSGGAVI